MRGRNTKWDSWHESSLDRKDFRDDHGSGPEEIPHKKAGGKNKWCGKKVGRTCEFTEKVAKWGSQRFRTFVLACPVCHKEGGRYWTSRLVEDTYTINGEEVKRSYWT